MPLAAPITEQAQKLQENKKPKLALTRQGRPVPRVKVMDDPDIEKALEMRASGRSRGQAPYPMTATNPSQNARSVPSSSPVDQFNIRYKPTLLTAEKGKLTSHRSMLASPSSWEPSTHSNSPTTDSHHATGSATRETATVSLTSVLESARDTGILEGEPADPRRQDRNTMDTGPDFPTSTSTVESLSDGEIVEVDKPSAGPPTVDELLRLSGADDTAAELPDFPSVETDLPRKSARSTIR